MKSPMLRLDIILCGDIIAVILKISKHFSRLPTQLNIRNKETNNIMVFFSGYLTKLELRSQSRELIVLADRIDPLTIGSLM